MLYVLYACENNKNFYFALDAAIHQQRAVDSCSSSLLFSASPVVPSGPRKTSCWTVVRAKGMKSLILPLLSVAITLHTYYDPRNQFRGSWHCWGEGERSTVHSCHEGEIFYVKIYLFKKKYCGKL